MSDFMDNYNQDFGDEYEENNDFENDDDYFEDDQPFTTVFKDRERVSQDIGGMTGTESELKLLTPEERFRTLLHIHCKEINTNKNFKIAPRDISMMEDKINFVNVEYTNNAGYILGYLVLDNEKKSISKERFDTVCKDILPIFESKYNIKKEDVIRYGRLWLYKLI